MKDRKDRKEKKDRRMKKDKKRESLRAAQDPDLINEDETSTKRKRTRKKVNREISTIAYFFVILFVGLLGYLTKFIIVDSPKVINNTYNKRQELLENSVQRGMILGSKGEVLAKSVYDDDDNMTRVYPYDSLFSHTVGRYLKTKTGLENSTTFTLLTSSINPIEKVFNDISGERSKGNNVVTTLDVDLQKVASDALGSNKGAVVVMEPSTGKILAMVSKPTYNPNTVDKKWESLIADTNNESALVNRATQSTYPPGSVYKILTALGYMRQFPDEYKNFTYTCNGKYRIGDDVVKCAGGTHHGEVDLEEAFAKSCNGAFATMLSKMDVNEFKKTNEQLLFNTEFNLDLSVRSSSFTLKSSDSSSLEARTAIGQGNTTTSPMHMAMIASAIANGGTLMKPYMIDRVENYQGHVVSTTTPKSYATLMSGNEAQILTSMMEEVVTKGTATALKTSKYTVAGKTGTAETAGAEPYSWFVGFSSKEANDVVVSVCVEDAGSSSSYAVPIAKKVFAAYYKK
ncbi:MAG: penicillin-binding transpeptidase domain-containing protein [bacterium]|nr:penicillin-binding transpeptidase domain-containing protein [bacterium]